MNELILNFFKELPSEWLIVIVSAMPVSELRGAIPLGVMMGMPLARVFFLSIIGNLLPVLPLLYLLEPVSNKLRKFKLWKNFFDWLFERTRRKAKLVEKYELLGLIILVAIPLPMTGAWTGSVAAYLFKLPLRMAIPCIILGILIAGVVVTLVSQGVISVWHM